MTTDVFAEPESRTSDKEPASTPYHSPQRLRELAGKPEFARRASDLRGLADAVAADPNHFDGWDRVNLEMAFHPAATISIPERTSKRRKYTRLLAAAAMFLPLLWTWGSLALAVRTYADGIQRQDMRFEGKPFLQLWAEGFGGNLLHELWFVAAVSAGLIGLIAALLIYDRKLRDEEHIEHNKAIQEAEIDLAIALSCVQREFARKTLTDGTTAESVAKSIRRMEQQQHAVEVATKEFSVAVKDASIQLATTVGNVEHVLESVRSTTKALDKAAESLDSTSRRVGERTQESLDRWADLLQGATAEHRAQVLDASKSHQDQLLAAAEKYRSGLAITAEDVAHNISLAANRVNTATESMKEALNEFSQSRDQATKEQNRLTAQVGEASQRIAEHTEQAIADLADQANSVNVRMTERSVGVIADVNNVVRGIGSTLVEVREGLGAFTDAVAEFKQAVSGQQHLTESQIAEMQNTTDLLGQVCHTVDEAARSLYLVRNPGNGR